MDQLEFEWSSEEELERYCQRILKNVAEEEMTPRQRFEATIGIAAVDYLTPISNFEAAIAAAKRYGKF